MVFHLPMSLRVAGQYGSCLSQTMLVTPDGGVPLTGTDLVLVDVPRESDRAGRRPGMPEMIDRVS
jgi:hypothetical protein